MERMKQDHLKAKILLVNDSNFELNFLKTILQSRGFDHVFSVSSAVEALAQIEKISLDGNKLEPDIILMNLVMPKIDGIEACKRIKAILPFRDIPVIIITSSDRDEKIKKAFDAGATDFLSIPIREVELIARVETALRLKLEMDQRKARENELKQMMKQLDEANKVLKELSFIDGLTNVYNRRYFEETLMQEWDRSVHDSHMLSLIIIDIDYFKQYNDHYGHFMGDDCLRRVAKVLKNSVQGSDSVSRYGGEEFAIILPETDGNGVFVVAQRLLQKVYQLQVPHEKSNVSPFVTISIGCCTMTPQSGMNLGQMIRKADEALYLAKAKGRDQVCLFDLTKEPSNINEFSLKSQV